ncbi:MAG TPA: HEAT repeat domain-containing protein, partial [Ohtaekwangia sp.]|nr:HEAT repeat domain-containing protein [Ohtaekwangia sp.]
ATDRLKAVRLSQEIGEVSSSVTRALIATLNNDPNVNVRLAALNALIPYVSDNKVRTELIKSIALQESPLVQLVLADVMAALQEKSSVKEFKKLLDDDRTPEEVKERIREKINVMI